jgi:hypothetical protein
MSEHPICAKCGKPIDTTQDWVHHEVSTRSMEDSVAEDSTEPQGYDYHGQHAPKTDNVKASKSKHTDEETDADAPHVEHHGQP